jgi:hypothetical protein
MYPEVTSLEREGRDLLADEEDIDGTEIEVVEVWHCRHAFSACMHTSVKLYKSALVLRTAGVIVIP